MRISNCFYFVRIMLIDFDSIAALIFVSVDSENQTNKQKVFFSFALIYWNVAPSQMRWTVWYFCQHNTQLRFQSVHDMTKLVSIFNFFFHLIRNFIILIHFIHRNRYHNGSKANIVRPHTVWHLILLMLRAHIWEFDTENFPKLSLTLHCGDDSDSRQ